MYKLQSNSSIFALKHSLSLLQIFPNLNVEQSRNAKTRQRRRVRVLHVLLLVQEALNRILEVKHLGGESLSFLKMKLIPYSASQSKHKCHAKLMCPKLSLPVKHYSSQSLGAFVGKRQAHQCLPSNLSCR